MDNARKVGLGLLFAILGFYIGRTYLPALPGNTLALSSFTARPSTVATPIPVAPTSPTVFTPVADPNAFPTPYPTPSDSAVVVATQPAPPVNSNPSLYPTPYPTPSGLAAVTSTPAPIAVNRAPEPASAPVNFSLDGLLDRQSHLVYLILGLLAVGILYRMRSNEPAICVAMLIIGIVLGHYIDPGPINITNPFNRVS